MSTQGGGARTLADAPRPGLATAARAWLWGWRAMAQLTTSLLLSGPYLAVAALLLAGVLSVPAMLTGVPMVIVALLLAVAAGNLERARLRVFTGVRVPPADPPPDVDGWRRLLDPRPWRASLHLLLMGLWGIVAGSAVLFLTGLAVAMLALPLYRPWLSDEQIVLPVGDGVVDAGAAPGLDRGVCDRRELARAVPTPRTAVTSLCGRRSGRRRRRWRNGVCLLRLPRRPNKSRTHEGSRIYSAVPSERSLLPDLAELLVQLALTVREVPWERRCAP